MVEGGAVDWAAHDHQSGRMIEEQIDFNLSIEAVIAWVEEHSSWNETLVIVTADHETGYLAGPGSGAAEPDNGGVPHWEPLGALMARESSRKWSGTPEVTPIHSSRFLPKGQEAGPSRAANEVDPVRGRYLDNSEIALVIFSFLQ